MGARMLRKGLAVAVILLFIGLCVIPPTAVQELKEKPFPINFDGNTLYVGGSGPNNYTIIYGVNTSYVVIVKSNNTTSALAVEDDDVELIIRGGFGVHFIVKKEADTPKVIANFSVYGRGIIFKDRFHNSSGHFPCFEFAEETELWYIIHPRFLPITATLEVNGKKLTRRGVNTMYVVIFFPLH